MIKCGNFVDAKIDQRGLATGSAGTVTLEECDKLCSDVLVISIDDNFGIAQNLRNKFGNIKIYTIDDS